MVSSVNPGTRRYRSSLRQQQAQLTRSAVFAAAQRLFLERGFGATTVAAVAAEAGVSTETIYATLGGKSGLLRGVIETTILGPDSTPLMDQVPWARIDAVENPHERLATLVAFVCDVLERTSPVHAVIRGAADSEQFAVELRKRLLDRRLEDIRSNLRRTLPAGVRPQLRWDQATERFAALASPEMHHLLTVELGWRPVQYRNWLTAIVDTDLLGTTTTTH